MSGVPESHAWYARPNVWIERTETGFRCGDDGGFFAEATSFDLLIPYLRQLIFNAGTQRFGPLPVPPGGER